MKKLQKALDPDRVPTESHQVCPGKARAPKRSARGFNLPGRNPALERGRTMEFILWIIAVILVISGIVSLFRGQMMWGAALIVLGLLVGPGGVSLFT